MDHNTTESDLSAASFSFNSATTAMSSLSTHSSPDTRLTEKGTARRRSSQPLEGASSVTHSHGINPYTTLAQLSYAPATQTTIVTTTTTTTTTFPPLVMKPPRNLGDRDPKLYPLASAATPPSIRNFTFDIDGRLGCFQEADNPEQSLTECKQKYATLQSANGVIRSVQEDGPHYQTPNRFLRHKTMLLEDSATSSLSNSNSKKRPASPSPAIPSIAEAAEIVSHQRKQRKFRSSSAHLKEREKGSASFTHTRPSLREEYSDAVVPATPDTDVGSVPQFKRPNLRTHSRRSQLGSTPHASSSRNTSSGSAYGGGLRLFGTPSVIDGPGLSATPPIAESDMEPVVIPEDPNPGLGRPPRPAPINTITTQNASLPSPSLSPTTAAATLAHHGSASTTTLEGEDDDDSNDVSSLDISQYNVDDECTGHRNASHIMSGKRARISSPSNVRRSNSTFMEIPTMLESFDALPDEFKTYVMYQMLRRCAKPTLHFVADVVNPALKCDFVGLLPLELSLNIVRYLDFQSMCRAAQVSRKWRQVINSDEKAWKELLDKDGYNLPEGELQRAIGEGWGWQFPHATESWERDLSESIAKSDPETSPSSSASSASFQEVEIPVSASGRPKRKAAAKYGSNKKQRRKGPSSTSRIQSITWMREMEAAHGPRAYAQAAMSAVPYSNVGLPSLRSLHLFKSLYARHHLIRKSWMVEDSRPQHITFRAHGRHVVTCLQFDTDKILTGSDDTNINVYDTKTGAIRARLEGHEGGVWALQYEGNTLVSGSTDRSVRVWDIEKAKCTQIFQGHTSTVRCLVILKPTKVGETSDGTPIMVPKEPLIITGSRDSSLRVWKLPGPNDRSIYQTGPPVNDYDNPYFIRALTGHHHSVRAIAAHADTLVSGSYDCSVRVWKISTGEVVHRLQGHAQKVYSVVLDHARNRCISGSMDNLVKVWSLDSGACLFNLEGHTSLVGLLDLSHDRLVSAAADSTLRIWDPENGQCKATLSAHTGAITCFQHDGQKVISGSDRTLKMWNIKTGECVKDLLTDLSGVWQVKFNERRCVAAVQRNNMTYIEVLDFGASRDGVPTDLRGRRIVVDSKGREIEEATNEDREQLEAEVTQV